MPAACATATCVRMHPVSKAKLLGIVVRLARLGKSRLMTLLPPRPTAACCDVLCWGCAGSMLGAVVCCAVLPRCAGAVLVLCWCCAGAVLVLVLCCDVPIWIDRVCAKEMCRRRLPGSRRRSAPPETPQPRSERFNVTTLTVQHHSTHRQINVYV